MQVLNAEIREKLKATDKNDRATQKKVARAFSLSKNPSAFIRNDLRANILLMSQKDLLDILFKRNRHKCDDFLVCSPVFRRKFRQALASRTGRLKTTKRLPLKSGTTSYRHLTLTLSPCRFEASIKFDTCATQKKLLQIKRPSLQGRYFLQI